MRKRIARAAILGVAALMVVAAFFPRLSAQSLSGHRSDSPHEGAQENRDDSRADFWSSGEGEAAIGALLSGLSDEEILGQLFMMAYPGTQPPRLLFDWISQRALGGIKVFGWNADDTEVLATAIREIQEAASKTDHRIPPFIATDQEGGWIRHVKGGTSVTPGNMAIGASALPEDAYKSALYIGRELASLGITMNFAPTVDLALKPRSSIIGPRAFSSDPAVTAVLAAAYAKGMEDSGVLPTAKHFPGHGDTEQDSHGVLPVISVDEATLWDRDLLPYRLLAAEGVPGIMSGHIAYPRITGDWMPASLSPYFLTDLLRKRMGYDGLIVTDDLFMTGAAVGGGFPEICVRAIMAGNDILVISRILEFSDGAWTRLLREYRTNPAFKARVRESASRVLKAKQAYLKPKGNLGVLPADGSEGKLHGQEAQTFFAEQAFRSATVLEGGGMPLAPDAAGRVVLAGPFSDFFAEGLSFYPGAEQFRFTYQPGPGVLAGELESFRRSVRGARAVIVSVANPAGAAFARAARDSGAPTYIVSVLSPAFALDVGKVAGSVAVYNFCRESYAAAFAVISGAVEGKGVLPIARRP